MRFGKKITCRGCQLSCLSDTSYMCIAGVNLKTSNGHADAPLEPCFKPKTRKEASTYYLFMSETMKANLAIYRAKLEA